MSILPALRFPRSACLIVVLFSLFVAHSGRSEDAIEVPLEPMVLLDEPIVARSGRPAILPVNVPLVDRVALTSSDVRGLSIKLRCKRAEAMIDVLLRGQADQAEFNLADEPTVQSIPLEAGQPLVIVGWKSSWHYNGSVELVNFEIEGPTPAGGSTSIAMPTDFPDGVAHTHLGRFELVGLANRDKFPAIANREAVRYDGKSGNFKVPSARGSLIDVDAHRIIFRTNGKADGKDPGYSWAPALLFFPKESGRFDLTGSLRAASSEKGQAMSWIVGILATDGPPLANAKISFHQLLHQPESGFVAESDYDAAPIAEHDFGPSPKGKEIITLEMAETVRGWMDAATNLTDLVAVVEGPDGAPAAVTIEKRTPGVLTTIAHPKMVLFDHEIKPEPGVFARHQAGKLIYGGKPLRLWSTVMSGTAERFRALGFNALRVWMQDRFYDEESAKRGEVMSYVEGDGSTLDRYDRFLADLREQGMFVMFGSTIGRGMKTKFLLQDDSWIAGGEGWEEWKAAVAENDSESFDYIDERLWKIRLKHAKNVLDHVNPYTGRRYAEEESIVLIEINNERAILKKWLEGGFEKWPAYFRDKLRVLWNEWLTEQYGNDAGLRKAWGALGSDESLDRSNVVLAPVVSQRKKFPEQRGNDLVRFLVDLIDRRNQEYMKFCRSLAPEGVGVNVIPFSFDSQYMPSLPWLYSNSLGDASTISMYFWNHESSLTKPPALYVLDAPATDEELTVVYETGRSRPSPFRSEHPYMLAVLAAWQDFDIVSWHGHWMKEDSPEQILAGLALPPQSHFWTGVHLEYDPTMTSSIALAGRIYLNRSVESAPDPLIIKVGKESATGYRHWNGIGGTSVSNLTFTRGTRIKFDLSQPGGFLNDGGDPLAEVPPTAGPVRTGEHVFWDWPNGTLVIDSPNAKVYVGPAVASHEFSDGITLSGLNTEWIAFALVSADGRPLTGEGATDRALVSAVFDSANTDFEFDWSVGGSPVKQAKAVKNLGHAPILVDEVHYTLSFPTEITGQFKAYDFAMRQTEEAALDATNTWRQRGPTPWMGEFTFASRGASKPVEIDPSPGLTVTSKSPDEVATESVDARLVSIPSPLPALTWGDNFARAHRNLRDGSYLHGQIIPADPAQGDQGKIEVSDVEGVFVAPANVEVTFADGTMSRILVTFTENPTLPAVIDRLSEKFGPPTSEALVEDAFKESKVTWKAPFDAGALTVEATEVQGVVRISYTLQPAN